MPLVQPVYYDNIHDVIDWDRIEGFDWDQGNRRKSADKHDVSQAEAEQIFFNDPLLVVEDARHSASPHFSQPDGLPGLRRGGSR